MSEQKEKKNPTRSQDKSEQNKPEYKSGFKRVKPPKTIKVRIYPEPKR